MEKGKTNGTQPGTHAVKTPDDKQPGRRRTVGTDISKRTDEMSVFQHTDVRI